MFYGQFCNTAIVVLLVYANFSELTEIVPIPELSELASTSIFFNGPYKDYQPLWFA